jgi:hypothetical protein
VDHRFAGFNQRSEVENRVKGAAFLGTIKEELFKQGSVAQGTFNKFRIGWEQITAAMA